MIFSTHTVFALFITASMALIANAEPPAKINLPPEARLIDVRSVSEYRSFHLPGAANFPVDRIERLLPVAIRDRATPLYLYCRSGRRVKEAIVILKKLGYRQLVDLGGLSDAKRRLFPDKK